MVLLKYQSNTWRTLEIPLIYCEITLNSNWSENYIIVATNIADQDTIFSITDTKRYVPLITLSTQDNAKLLEWLKSGFKWTTNWSKYQAKRVYINGRSKSIFRFLNWSKFSRSK